MEQPSLSRVWTAKFDDWGFRHVGLCHCPLVKSVLHLGLFVSRLQTRLMRHDVDQS